jgi:pimeloyl-ACP methyl ester carboxylesterase
VGIYTFFKTRSAKPFEPTHENLNLYTFAPAQDITDHDLNTAIDIHGFVDHFCNNKKPDNAQLIITDHANNPKKITTVQRGIPGNLDHEIIFVSSRGYAKRDVPIPGDYLELIKNGGCALSGHMLIKDNIVTDAPCITFDYPDQRNYFSFGQDTDIHCLHTVWEQVTAQYPNANIIGIGDCRGGKTFLELATTRPPNLKALILLSPFVSAWDMSNQLAKNYLGWLPKSGTILHEFFNLYFPNFRPEKDNLMSKVQTIAPDLPIFIGYRHNDYLASLESMHELMRILHTQGNNHIYFVTVSDNHATHSRITPIPELQWAVNAFLARYALPHHKELADLGKPLLEAAHYG